MSIHRHRRRLVRGVYMSRVHISRILMPTVERVDVCNCIEKRILWLKTESLKISAIERTITRSRASLHSRRSPPFHINEQTKGMSVEMKHKFKLKSIIITSAIGYYVSRDHSDNWFVWRKFSVSQFNFLEFLFYIYSKMKMILWW